MNALGRVGQLLARLAAALMAVSALPAAELRLDNGLVSAAWPLKNGVLGAGTVRDRDSGAAVSVGPGQAWLEFGTTEIAPLDSLRAAGVAVEPLLADPGQARLAGHFPGRAIVARFVDPAGHYQVVWRAELRAGSRYLLIALEMRNTGAAELPLTGAGLIDLPLAGASTVGDVNGSPVVAGGTFLAVEHPLAHNLVAGGQVRCRLPRLNPLGPGENTAVPAVVGFTAPGQLRRGFLAYLERERARPYRPFLYYNTWYDIGYFNRFDQDRLAEVIRAFGRELVRGRGVKLDAFVLDDGWDDPRSLWNFHGGFPRGLGPADALAAKLGAGIGIWLSPWGGYGPPKQERLQAGIAAGLETREGSFSLAGPRYYRLFRDRCAELLRRDGVIYFKFDGIGSSAGPDRVDPAAGRDFEAMMRLIAELRRIAPEVFINQTTGTWPSPFWLQRVDTIWRGGEDHDFAGVGSDRERWITYRDAQTYRNVVRRAPLFPLNSLMLHGLIYAAHADRLQADPGDDFAREVRAYFGSGTQLQEMYISPQLLTARNWDQLAAAARWSRANAGTLVDTHWIGGDPGRLEVYGWAAWSPAKGIITLRNPCDRPARFEIDVRRVFELPARGPRVFSVSSPYPDAPAPVAVLRAGEPVTIALPPFGVRVLEAMPAL